MLQRTLSLLPNHLHLQCRLASSTTTPTSCYPYPTHPDPTPHQIFHLPASASQQDIKARLDYDLVRLHHPDSPVCRSLCESPSERQSRFQAIAAAYDVLRGHTPLASNPFAAEVARRRRAWGSDSSSHRRRHEYAYADLGGGKEWKASADDRWKDRIIVVFGIITLAAGITHGLVLVPLSLESHKRRHLAASTNLAEARREAREHGDVRRREIGERVAEFRREEEKAIAGAVSKRMGD